MGDPLDRDDGYRHFYNSSVNSDPHSTSSQLVTTVDDMILDRQTPQQAAEKIATIVMTENEPKKPYQKCLAICQHAALHTDDQNISKKLVDFITALASLPDAVNDSSEPKTATTYNPEVESGILTFQPGEAIVFENGRLWRDLPDWSMSITETHQGQ